MGAYLAATGRGDVATLAQRYSHLLTPDEGCVYDRVIEINLDELGPHINGPFTPDLCTAVADMPDERRRNAVGVKIFASSQNDLGERGNGYGDIRHPALVVRRQSRPVAAVSRGPQGIPLLRFCGVLKVAATVLHGDCRHE